MKHYDILLRNGLVFDGRGSSPVEADVGITDGLVVDVAPWLAGTATEEISARGRWVMPGFIDFHTHYDAEIEIDASLSESVRHGVTTVFLGSCSLGASVGTPEDICDIFCRVEGVPRSTMLPLFERIKDWNTFPEYLDHLETLPLGPNVCVFVGHSNLRMAVLGFERSLDGKLKPSGQELDEMVQLLEEALDVGYVGLSIQTLPWDKLDGDRFRSQPLPSYFARWSEYRKLTRVLRRRDRIFQGVPNVTTKVNVLLFLLESIGLFRKPLKTTVISLMDVVANRTIHWSIPILTRLANRFLGADFRFQALPNAFDVWADGMDLVIFEEFAAGTEAIHLADLGQRAELLRDEEYRRRFRKQWTSIFAPRVYHRDFKLSTVLACPNTQLVGRSFHEIALERGVHVVDAFLDLTAEFGEKLRWYSVVANDRRGPLEKITAHPDVLIGFSDAGAHLRNMAHYSYPLRLLKLVQDAEARGEGFMSIERAVHRVTGEIGDWFNVPLGHLEVGTRADVVVVDPTKLDERLDEVTEEEMPGFDGLSRLVRRSDDAVPLVIINGKVAARHGVRSEPLGQSKQYGTLIRAKNA